MRINGFGGCGTDDSGSGQLECNKFDKGLLIGFILAQKGWRKTLTPDYTEALYKQDVKDMKLIPYIGVFDYSQANEENVTETAPTTGLIATIRNGNPSFTFVFNNGYCQHKSIYAKQGNNNYDLILVYEKGLQVVDKDTEFTGFKTSNISVASYMEKTTESAKTTVTIQLKGAEDYNMHSGFLSNEDLGFDVADVNGVIDVKLIIGTNTATTIPVQVVGACNSSYNVTGLDGELSWVVTNTATGVVIPTTVEVSTNGYVLTGTAIPLTGFTVTLLAEDTETGNVYKGSAKK